MYSFANRSDFAVMDEPFYAPYLGQSGIDHPMRNEIMSQHETNPDIVAQSCEGVGTPHLYMKQMPHHMINGFPMGWANRCVHVHLIRHPARVIASYAAKREAVDLNDIGFVQQAAIYNQLGGLVIDCTDIRAAPEAMLRVLCLEIGLAFDPAMLQWPKGPHPDDGIWAQHWYGAVHASTGFAGAEGPLPELSEDMAQICAEALPYYEQLSQRKISV